MRQCVKAGPQGAKRACVTQAYLADLKHLRYMKEQNCNLAAWNCLWECCKEAHPSRKLQGQLAKGPASVFMLLLQQNQTVLKPLCGLPSCLVPVERNTELTSVACSLFKLRCRIGVRL